MTGLRSIMVACAAVISASLAGCQSAPAAEPAPSIFRTTPGASSSDPSPGALASPSPARSDPLPPVTLVEAPISKPPPGWPDNPQGTAHFVTAGYQLTPHEQGHFVAVRAPFAASLRDVTIAARFQKVGGPPGGGYGLIVRDQSAQPLDGVQQDGRFYVLEASDQGEIGIWLREGQRWVDLLGWSKAKAVRTGNDPNELTAQAVGSQLSFTVNGTLLVKVTDTTLADGAVGVFAGGDGNQVLLDHLTVQVLSS